MSTSGRKPNVVVFFTDQQRWDTTGVHGNPLGLTPNFDRVAKSGTHAALAFTPQPVCGPARSVMMSGRYATSTGCFRNGIPLPAEVPTLAHHFRDAGYHTGYIGKWHLAADEPVPEDQRGGFQHWLAANLLEFSSDAYSTIVYNEDCEQVQLPGYRVDALADAAIRYIDQHKHEPFFLFLSLLEPHHQNHRDDYPAPDGYAERYTGAWTPPDLVALRGSSPQHLGGYYGMVKRIDEAFGRLLDALKSLDLDDDTVVLFTSDHGCHFKTRNDEYKRSCHESSIRVPLALTGPGLRGGGELQHPVSLVDVAPTLLDAAGLPIPPEMQGRSLLSLTRGAAHDWPDDVFVQISEAEVGRAVRTSRWKYHVVAPDKHPNRDAGSDTYQEASLYDLLADPYELTNLAGLDSHAEAAAVLRERLLRRMKHAGEAVPRIEPAPPRPGGQRRVTSAEARA